VVSCPATPSSARPTFSQLTLLGSETDSIISHNFTHSTPPHTARSQIASVGRPQVYQPSPYLSLPPPAHLTRSGTSSRSSISSVTSSPSIRQDVHNHTRRAFSDSILPADAFFPTRSQSGTSTPQKSSSTLGSIPDAATLAKLDAKLPGSDLMSDRSMDGNSYKQRIGVNRIPSRTPSPEDGSSTLPSVHEGSTEEETSTGSESGQDSTNSQQSRRPQLLTAYSVPLIVTAPIIHGQVPEPARGDLSLLHTHRLSHVAEVGQLLPRTRQSRILSGANTLGLSPSSVVASSGTFYSPAVLDPVYALDIALPSPALGSTGNLARSNTHIVTERQRSYSDPAIDNIESLVDEHIQDAFVSPNRPVTRDKSGWKSRESIDDREEESDLDQNKTRKKLPRKYQDHQTKKAT